MTRPLIQVDDFGNSREMTEEEHAAHVALWQQSIEATKTINVAPPLQLDPPVEP